MLLPTTLLLLLQHTVPLLLQLMVLPQRMELLQHTVLPQLMEPELLLAVTNQPVVLLLPVLTLEEVSRCLPR